MAPSEMRDEPRWLTRLEVIAINVDQIERHGGYYGLREHGTLLDAALGRPRNKYHYQPDVDLADLAAAYAFAIIKTTHPFLDANERTGLMAAFTFLGLNGCDFSAPMSTTADTIFALAAGHMSEDQLAAWFRANIQPLGAPGRAE